MNTPKILIIDDDPDIRRALKVRLRSEGFEVAFAVDAMTAVSVARRESPDVIVLDLGLPGGDGFDVLERFRDLPDLESIPVIVLSARSADKHKPRSLDLGACSFIEKPFEDEDLLATIHGLIPGRNTATSPPIPITSSRTPRVLVVEDDEDVRRGLAVVLRANGYEAHTSADAISAVTEARKAPPDLVVLDLGLPGGHGLDVVDRIRDLNELWDVPFVVVTGRDAAAEGERAYRAGAAGFFNKPIDPGELLPAIRTVLDKNMTTHSIG